MLLKFFRKRKNMKLIMWGIAILIIPAFVIWGSGSSDKKKTEGPGYAGKIFGKKISYEQYADMWQVSRDYAVRAFGANVPPEMIDQLAWNRLLLLEEAEREKITADDRDVIKQITSFQAFQRNGVFDKKLYKSALGDSARGFEERIRDDIRISKLRDRVISEVSVTDEEVKEEYKKKHEKIKSSYILAPFKDFEKNVTYQEPDLIGFYGNNKTSFSKPETINVKYIDILFSGFNDKVSIGEDSIRKYFEEHLEDYKKPGSEEIPEFTDDIKNGISEKLSSDRKKSLAEELAYKVLDAALEKNNLNEPAREFNLQSGLTGFFSMQEAVPDIGWSYELAKTGFELGAGEISDTLIKTDKGFYIIQLAEKRKPYIPEFKEAREEIKEAYIKNKSAELAGHEAKKIHEIISGRLRSGENFQDICKELSIEIKQTDLITRDAYMPGLGMAANLVEACASLKPGEISSPIKMQDNWVTARLDEYQNIDETKFLEEKEEFSENFLEKKKQEAFDQWFEALKKQAGFVNHIAR
jgi:peptidyl-prolyl cis-trans isomerase D